MKKAFIIAALMLISSAAFTQAYNQSNLFYNTNKTYVRFVENPAKGQINIQISNPYSEKYDLSLYSLAGQKITETSFAHTGGVSTITLYVPVNLRGMYFLVAKTTEGHQSLKILIQ
jgi:uncharacterized protein YxeA